MLIRPAYPDELGRARSLLEGHPVPPGTEFLLGIKEHPVERIVASIPWWKVPDQDSEGTNLRFYLGISGHHGLNEESLESILTHLEELARKEEAHAIFTDFSLPEQHPLYQALSSFGYTIAQTDRYFSFPGEPANQRTTKLYQRVQSKIPTHWKVESIRGHSPEKIYALVGEQHLMSPQKFQNYWDAANRERFEEDYSCVVLEEDKVIGVFLVTQRGSNELHVHVDVVAPSHRVMSGLITIAMRNFTCTACPEGFPGKYTSLADSQRHIEGGNTPLRYPGGVEHEPLHFLSKQLNDSINESSG